ncbi:hypothetical protein KC19_12G043000 [Ceratodon purpureus]|uniref:Uncharacterized protein n=1 Tax=Ceratodon purpureus TaxID=3225 RepID=A0A8T0G722_CERPU|nr:hypothetical protein KC19_12G043000 [Ceratodon purpureus]
MAISMWTLIAAVVVAVAVAANAQPVSRLAPYTATITAGKTSAPLVVLKTQNYIVSLEGNPCAITIRHLFSSKVAHLLWTSAYHYSSIIPLNANTCTLKLTSGGNLQLIALTRGFPTTVWTSLSTGMGIVKMALENKFDSGELQLLTAGNVIKYSSFQEKEFALLPRQKISANTQTLVAPDKFFAKDNPQILFSGHRYTMMLVSGDLILYSTFKQIGKQYWSLKKTLAKNVDIRFVASASIVPSVGGIGLYKLDGTLLWTFGKISIGSSNPHDTYLSVDPDGNLRTYVLVKGQFWRKDFEAITNVCDLPDACGPYGVCNNGKCSCLPSWVPIDSKDSKKGCKTQAPMKTCSSGKQTFRSYSGYDQVYNKYDWRGLKISKAECEFRCYGRQPTCGNCSAYFYDDNTKMCYLTNEVRTLRKVTDLKKTVNVKV